MRLAAVRVAVGVAGTRVNLFRRPVLGLYVLAIARGTALLFLSGYGESLRLGRLGVGFCLGHSSPGVDLSCFGLTTARLAFVLMRLAADVVRLLLLAHLALLPCSISQQRDNSRDDGYCDHKQHDGAGVHN